MNPIDIRQRLAEKAKTLEEQLNALTSGPTSVWGAERCKVCRSGLRADVDRLKARGASQEQIAQWMRERGVNISRESVRRHINDHVNVTEALAAVAFEKAEDITRQVESERSDLDRLGAYIERTTTLERSLTRYIEDCVAAGKAPPMSVVKAHETVTNGLRQAIKLRSDLQGDMPSDNFDHLLSSLWALEA
ncbi:MAG: hypothetical protein K6V73_10945 [Firmicutes bacterium]|nr:hypothetical protein [Bacillota bacterium]